MRRVAAFVLLVSALPAVAGCGPLMSTYLIISAQAELDGASAAEAEKHAVYEYTAASEYLSKAREEQGYADYGPSIDFAFKANELATKAKEKAEVERQKARVPDTLPPGAEPPPDGTSGGQEAPKVIIKKAPESTNEGQPVGVEIVPITPDEGTRPPQ